MAPTAMAMTMWLLPVPVGPQGLELASHIRYLPLWDTHSNFLFRRENQDSATTDYCESIPVNLVAFCSLERRKVLTLLIHVRLGPCYLRGTYWPGDGKPIAIQCIGSEVLVYPR